MIRHENLSEEMLENLGEVLGHSNITTWTQPLQYGFLERLTDSNGTNLTSPPTTSVITSASRCSSCTDVTTTSFIPLTEPAVTRVAQACPWRRFSGRRQDLDGIPASRSAHRPECRIVDVFPRISEFLQNHRDAFRFPETEAERQARRANADQRYYFRRPLIGPLLGWLRHDQTRTPGWRACGAVWTISALRCRAPSCRFAGPTVLRVRCTCRVPRNRHPGSR